ncbi:uncharacterized protein BT62DRAFT_933884 [Guyanagaster necrorhizus]|uniref:TPX2 C-terminal domain-containing protein n=1 Tax=Guyanagaster necrorhizus TaxID=856835 RepID=A0A9P7VQI9_9AGAR|nr:uncharacterized protein BT62DRAFT_933884 [Guyanagaster necrorhizus MCA 3950]KAG7444833.1 hypothetical protein BT62DRAFT_933884 [Guyanagaster necrorhizus MCA 3950]
MQRLQEISLRHLPDVSGSTFSLEDTSFQIPVLNEDGEDLLNDSDNDFFRGIDARSSLATPAPARRQVHDDLTVSQLTPRRLNLSPSPSKSKATFPANPRLRSDSPSKATPKVCFDPRAVRQAKADTPSRRSDSPPKSTTYEPTLSSTPVKRHISLTAEDPFTPRRFENLQAEVATLTSMNFRDGLVSTKPRDVPAISVLKPVNANVSVIDESFDTDGAAGRLLMYGSTLAGFENVAPTSSIPPRQESLTVSKISPQKNVTVTRQVSPVLAGMKRPASSTDDGPRKREKKSQPQAKPPIITKPTSSRSKASTNSSKPRPQPPPSRQPTTTTVSLGLSRSRFTSAHSRNESSLAAEASGTSTSKSKGPPVNAQPTASTNKTLSSSSRRYAIPDFKALHAAEEARLAARKELIIPVKPIAKEFNTDERIKERRMFDERIKEKEAEMERALEERRKQREEEEERQVRELRRKAVPKAHEVPEWYKDAPKRVRPTE